MDYHWFTRKCDGACENCDPGACRQGELLDPAEELSAAKADPEGRELSPAAQALYEAEGAARFAEMHGGRNRRWEWADVPPGVPPTAPTQLCKECGGLGHFPFGNGNSAGKCADCKGTGRVPAGVGPFSETQQEKP